MAPLSKGNKNKYNKFWLYVSLLVVVIILAYVLVTAYSSREVADIEAPVSDNNIGDNGNDREFRGPTEPPPTPLDM